MSAIVSLYPNFPVFSMVLAAGLAYIPHFLRGFIVLRATKRWDNVNPRGQMERIQAKMTKEDWQMAKRAEGAHNNGIETLPVFYGAVLAALYTGVPKDTVTFYAGLFVATRALFNVVYIFNTNQGTAFVRTGLWTAGIASCVKLFLAAANTKY